MSEVVNLRRFRKQKTRDEAAKTAQANRVAFGLSKAEREKAALQNELDQKRVEGHRMERTPSPDDKG